MDENIKHNPELLLSADGGITWKKGVQVVTGCQYIIKYKIIFNGASQVRLIIPVCGSVSQYLTTDPDQSLINSDDWNALDEDIQTEVANITIQKFPKSIGVYNITCGDPELAEIVFQIGSGEKPVFQQTAIAACWLREGKNIIEESKAWISLTKNTKAPIVNFFTAERTVLVNNQKAAFSWSVSDATTGEITSQTNKYALDGFALDGGHLSTEPLKQSSKFTLEVQNQDHKAEINPSVQINIHGKSELMTVSNAFQEADLVGLYPFGDKLYALCIEFDDVYLYESVDGLLWKRSAYQNRGITFTNGKTIVPQEFAGSAGVVFNDKIYLIGGSRFYPDQVSNNIFFLDFHDLGNGWQQEETPIFKPRMGHAAVVHGNEIWIIGGFMDTGTCTEVWKTTDGRNWVSGPSLASPLCMASAISFESRIELFGGYGDVPGKLDQSILTAQVCDGQRWTTYISGDVDKSLFYNCTAVSIGVERFLITTVANGGRLSRVNRINGIDWEPFDGWSMDSYWFNIQAVSFKGVIWMCGLSYDDKLYSADLRYFIYVPQKS